MSRPVVGADVPTSLEPSPSTANTARLLTVADVAQRLGVSKDWVWAQARAGRIPHVQLGRYRRFREAAIEEWLERLETESVKR
jgi:excisionase family DNA binding protein